MIVHVDAKQLEWYCAVFLSQDPTGMQELIDNVDLHEINRSRFNLPERRVAKFFLFRLIFGGTEFAYANDPDFMHVSTSTKFWRKVIDEAYAKYAKLHETHEAWVREVIRTGKLVVPTGREYLFESYRDDYGNLKWPKTQIYNYPVQGLGHDLMAIVRVELFRRIRELGDVRIKLISTVHDSVDVDCPESCVSSVVRIISESFAAAPQRFKEWFGIEFNLPLRCEIFVGKDLKNLTQIA